MPLRHEHSVLRTRRNQTFTIRTENGIWEEKYSVRNRAQAPSRRLLRIVQLSLCSCE